MAAHAFTLNKAISPWMEMGAYEALWDVPGTSFKSLALRFGSHPGSLPSDFVQDELICEQYARRAIEVLNTAGVHRFGVRMNGAGDYPVRLRDAEYRVELLYFQGLWS